ncbi:MAG: hypothetical protein NQU46_08705 [Methanolinea sp.]|nr:hypothetical protein [Methanolinea sp.]
MDVRTFLTLTLFIFSLAGVAAATVSIDVQPHEARIGDRVHITGTTDGKNLIAVFLLVTGPGLDRAGVTLENIHLKAGSGYFTSAFVNPDGTFAYDWDTSFIVGHLSPGMYRIYAINVPLNLERLANSDEISVASTEVIFTKPPSRELAGFGPALFLALVIPTVLFCARRKNKG